MTNEVFRIELPEKLQFLLTEKHRYKVAYGGRGSSKSFSMILASLAVAMKQKTRILCVRQFQNSIADSVYKLICDNIYRLKMDGYFEITQSSIRCVNGSEYIFKGIHNNVQEIKSLEGVDLCLVEEAQNIPDDSWEVLIPTIRKEGSEFWICFNPQREDDATYRRFVKNPPDDCKSVLINYMDNPWFPEVLRKEMEYCKRIDYPKYEHIWLGKTVMETEAQIFKGKFELLDFEAEPYTEFFYGADWGFSADATTLIRCFIEDGCLYIDYEAYGVGVEMEELPQLFDSVPESRKWRIRADCARPETISFVARHGFDCIAAEKWQGSIEDGIEYMRSFKKIYIHPRCKHTYEEFKYYSYKKDRVSGDILPIVVDAWNHCLINGTLIHTFDGLKPIEKVKQGDLVYTRKGYKPVLWAGISDKNRVVYKLKTKCGLEIIGTDNHKVLTSKGFCDIVSLRYGDKLLIKNKEWLKRQKCLGRYGIGIQNPKGELIGNTLRMEQPIYTDMYGNELMGNVQKGLSFITKMGIVKTMIYPIWKLLHKKNIEKDIRQQMMQNKKQGRELKGLDICGNGINRKKVKNGTKNTQKSKNSVYLICQKKIVSFAKRFLSPKQAMINSVQMLAKVLGVEKRELITLLKVANGVEKTSQAINIQREGFVVDIVQSVEVVGIAKNVYDITVAGQHEFFANGILVHNCIDATRYALQPYIKNHGKMRINPDWEVHVDAIEDGDF